MQLLHEQYKSLGFHSFAENALADTQSDAGQEYDEEEGGRQNMGKTPVGRRASKESARSHPYSGRPSKKSAADPLAVAMAQFDMPATCDFDCPIHKWHLMYGRAPPCNGCGKEHMNGVRQHLLPTYSQQHQVQLPFIKRCDNCKEDIVDERVWTQGGHRARNQRQAAGACRARSQPQGNSVIVWARLFLKIYPGETRIPSPCMLPVFRDNDLADLIEQIETTETSFLPILLRCFEKTFAYNRSCQQTTRRLL